MNRRGFTLIEVMVAIVLSTIVLAIVYQAIVSTQRVSHAQAQRIDVQQTLRSVTNFVSSRLREIDAVEGDIINFSANSIEYRGMQWAGFICDDPNTSGGGVRLQVRKTPFFGFREPVATDHSVFVYADANVNTRTDDQWITAPTISSVSDDVCADGSASWRVQLTASGTLQTSLINDVTNGSPVRGFGVEELSIQADGGRQWLRLRWRHSGSGTWLGDEIVAGPLQAGGLAFTYLDASGNATGTSTNVASIGLTVLAESGDAARAFGSTGFIQDSLLAHIAVRNNPRF